MAQLIFTQFIQYRFLINAKNFPVYVGVTEIVEDFPPNSLTIWWKMYPLEY